MNATRILARPVTWSSLAVGLLVACLPSHAQEGGVPGDGATPADQAPRSRSATEEQAGFTLAEGFTAGDEVTIGTMTAPMTSSSCSGA